MKKIIVFLSACVMIMSFTACHEYTESEKISLQRECEALERQKVLTQKHLTDLQQRVVDLEMTRNAYSSGKNIKYIVKFKIKQGTFTLDIFEHVKNNMNAIEIEIPVDKGFYDKLKINQDITNSFKWGSLIFNGDFSNLHMKVIGKRIEYTY